MHFDPAAEVIASLQTSAVQAGPLTTTLRDLGLTTEWHDLRVLNLTSEWTVIIGHKRKSDPLRAVLPLPLHTTALKPSSLKAIFEALSSLDADALPPALPPFAPAVEDLEKELAAKRQTAKELTIREKEASGTAEEGTSEESWERVTGAESLAEGVEGAEGENNTELERDMIYVAITTSDSTVVYYRLSKGIRKPADIPDE